MDKLLFSGVVASGLLATSLRKSARTGSRHCSTIKAPFAKRVPHIIKLGDVAGSGLPGLMSPPVTKVDDLFWLRDDDRKNPEVLAHLRAENEYTAAKTSHLTKSDDGSSSAVDKLYAEFKSRMKETDAAVPYEKNGYWYFTRTIENKSYPVYCRLSNDAAMRLISAVSGKETRSLSAECGARAVQIRTLHSEIQKGTVADEEILLDVNAVAGENKMCDVLDHEVSEDNSLLCFAVDFSGSEVYTLRIRDVSDASGKCVEELNETSGSFVWDDAGTHLYYLTHDEQHRPFKLWQHRLGSSQSEDVCMFTEDDERFWLGIHKSRTGQFIIVNSSSKLTSENFVIPLRVASAKDLGADTPIGSLHIVNPRAENVLYDIEHFVSESGSYLVIVTNKDGAKNFKVMVTPLQSRGEASWRDAFPHNKESFITGIDCFHRFWAIYGRSGGFPCIWLVGSDRLSSTVSGKKLEITQLTALPSKDEVFMLSSAGGNYDYEAEYLRFAYSSPICPPETCMVNANSAAPSWGDSIEVLKCKEVPNFVRDNYRTKRISALAADGTSIPISIVYSAALHAGTSACPLAKPAPLFLYAYGAYGHSCDMNFDFTNLSLCDRGVVYAVAHVRGGSEMGRSWYEDFGRQLTKWNTFLDFVSVADHLVASGWTTKGAICANGASAGGLLMGVVMNTRPELWAGILSQVGFVDVVSTMSDESIPLTVTEYDEWGNPHEERSYKYIASYSPIDNVRPQAYPPALLTAGLHDSRVGYWEPAKFAQRLRACNTGRSEILLKTELDGGHFSFMDRYAYLKDTAFDYAWAMDMLGVKI